MKQMVLDEQKHQHSLDIAYMDKEYVLRERGQKLAFSVFLIVILLGGYSIYQGFEWGGSLLLLLVWEV